MPKAHEAQFIRLDGLCTSLLLDCTGVAPAALYWGAKLPDSADPQVMALLASRQAAPCSPATEAPITLSPLIGQGFPGHPGLQLHRNGAGWSTYTAITQIDRKSASVEVTSVDEANKILIRHRISLDPQEDVLVCTTHIVNQGEDDLSVDWCAAPTLPLPSAVTHWTSFEGRWAGEFQTRTIPRESGELVRENRRGRTSHDKYPALLAEVAPCGELAGEVYGMHLAWSGNHRLVAETLSDGRVFVQMGELFMPGELRLAPGAAYDSPALLAGFSSEGRSGLSRAFHDHLRARSSHGRLRSKPRPVHYNTWEAVYFDHDSAKLMQLADAAAQIGAERFVLDDGWFRGRRNDKAGLGDWYVDEGVYPQGLSRIVDHVLGLGLEFGLWVEPEMVNPDSDLFRAHPEWVLGTPPAPQLSFRNQLVLDFGREEVREYIFERIDALLRAYPISYLKWDMNRDINHPGGADGHAGAHAHVLGLYGLLARIRTAHPEVEIESCSAGGGRADLGILQWTDRLWTSDSNDALDRLSIQKGLSLWVPSELMGSHVGPTDCHITGRRISMATRVMTAMFGHFGIEADLLALTSQESDELAAGVSLHKRHRHLIHSGDLFRIDRAQGEHAFGIVSRDKGEALFSYTQVTEPVTYFADRLRLAGLDPSASYTTTLVWPKRAGTPTPLLEVLEHGLVIAGGVLMDFGLELPRLKPQAGLVLHLQRHDASCT